MQDLTTRHEIPVLKSQLRLPLQAAPIDRTMMSSAVARESGVEPSMGLRWFHWILPNPSPYNPLPPLPPSILL